MMKPCIDCGKRTRREHWERERERFRQAAAKVWRSIRAREANGR